MALFIERPETVSAIQFTGDNAEEIRTFIGEPDAMLNAKEKQMFIRGPLGQLTVHMNYWVIKKMVPSSGWHDAAVFNVLDPVTFAGKYFAADTSAKASTA